MSGCEVTIPYSDEEDMDNFGDDISVLDSISTVSSSRESLNDDNDNDIPSLNNNDINSSFGGIDQFGHKFGNTIDIPMNEENVKIQNDHMESLSKVDEDINGNNKIVSSMDQKDAFGRCTLKGRTSWFTAEYGTIFRLMDGEVVPRELNKPMRKSTANVKYIKGLYSNDISLAELSVGDDTKRIRWGTFFKSDPSVWNIWTSQDKLGELTTLDIQRNVAAAVNSRRKMKWAIGVETNGKVTGVELNEEEKDILRQSFDFSLAREFVPELDYRIAQLQFLRVSAVTGNRCLVLISINDYVQSLHQLSSGRIFYLVDDKVVLAENMNQIKRALEERDKHEKGMKKSIGLNDNQSNKMIKSIILIGGSIGLIYAIKHFHSLSN